MEENDKVSRVLAIYTKLMNGAVIDKEEEARRYGVNKRSIQRDIDDIRDYLGKTNDKGKVYESVQYDYKKKGYHLKHIYKMKLKNSEILAICKILLESRSMNKKEMTDILERLIKECVPIENQKTIREFVANEEFHYIEPQHKESFIDKMWEINQAIQEHRYIELEYKRTKEKEAIKKKLKPVAILFSEYYFYLTALIDNEVTRGDFNIIKDSFLTMYRIDRIGKLKVLDEKFHTPYTDELEEREFRKRIQFIRSGALQRVQFKCNGALVETVFDRLPTAKILHEDETGCMIEAEVFGEGIKKWIRSQGEQISEVSYN